MAILSLVFAEFFCRTGVLTKYIAIHAGKGLEGAMETME